VEAAKRWHAGAAFANTFRDLKNHSNTTLFTAGLLLIPSMGTTFLENYLGSRLVSLISFPVTLAFGIWLQASLIRATYEYATGSDPGLGGLLARSSNPRRLFSLLGVQVILFLLWSAAGIVAAAPVIGVAVAGLAASRGDFRSMMNGGFAGLFIVALLIGLSIFAFFVVVIAFRYMLAAPVNVLEKLGAPASFGRSRRMMQKRWLDLLLLFLILLGIAIAGALALLLPAGIVASAGEPPTFPTVYSPNDLLAVRQLPVLTAAVVALAGYLFAVFTTSVSVGAITNFYLGVRSDEAMSAAAAVSPPGRSLDLPAARQNHGYSDDQQQGAGDDSRPGNLAEE
jgi:MFS family permease